MEQQTIIETTVRKYGWKRDLPSSEYKYLQVAKPSKIVHSVTLPMPPVYIQGELGSCTANSLSAAFEFEQIKQNLNDFMPSRLFIYYNERKAENTLPVDNGASLSTGINTLINNGVCTEITWPYNINAFTTQPSNFAYTEARNHQVQAARRVNTDVNSVKTVLQQGYPVCFGFTVYSSFETIKNDGIMSMPNVSSEKILGGHAVVVCGYDDNKIANGLKGYLLVRNSWGPTWGKDGYFWMPYNFFNDNNCADCWVISKNEATLVATFRPISFFRKQLDKIQESTKFVLKKLGLSK